ncbi:MAG: BamA/TamA family outer membrane protein [Roseobacter sp.]|nr:BamA/TamA family outer membrane protein [Roseobacter sp.]
MKAKTCLTVAAVLSLGPFDAAKANPDVVGNSFSSVRTTQEKTEFGLRNGSFLAVPVPFSNPVIGSGLSLGAGYLFQLAPEADTSFVGLGAMGSNNGSQAYGLAANVSFGSGWSFNLAMAEADVRYDLFFGSLKLPIEQDGELFNGGFTYDVTETSSFGFNLRYLSTTIGLRTEGSLIPEELLPDLSLELATIGLSYAWDRRDDHDYPTDGALLSFAVNRGFSLTGASRSYEYASANFDAYRTVGSEKVIAGRISTCAASSDAPFFDQCSIGFTDGFRGFNATQFYDARLVSAQAEYRQRLGERFGFVVFGGIGWTGESYGNLTDNGDRIAGGLGLRYRVSQKFPVDLSVDLSTNNDEEEFLYIFVGQRF